jgi:hypothetical protein
LPAWRAASSEERAGRLSQSPSVVDFVFVDHGRGVKRQDVETVIVVTLLYHHGPAY